MSYNALRVFAETKYPFVVSTKGRIIAEPEYLELLKKCNCVVQISMVCSSYDKLEEGAPSFEERLEIARKVAPSVKRLIVRIQPYMHEVYGEVYENLEKFKAAGAYGVIVEGMKFASKRPGLVVLLQCIREYFGKPVTITSGYRTASHNTRVGGSKSSQHLLGRAADIQVQDTDPLAVAAYAESLMPGWGGVGRYPVKAGRAKGWVHVDTRPNKSRWTL